MCALTRGRAAGVHAERRNRLDCLLELFQVPRRVQQHGDILERIRLERGHQRLRIGHRAIVKKCNTLIVADHEPILTAHANAVAQLQADSRRST